MSDVSCPSPLLCVGTDARADVITSTNPTGGAAAWTVTHVSANGSSPDAVSCPSATLCIAGEEGGDDAGDVLTSTNPTGGSAAWTASKVPATSSAPIGAPGVQAMSCPSATLCVAGDSIGDRLTTTNPAGGGSAWTASRDPSGTPVVGLSCPSPDVCVAAATDGSVLTSTTPAGGSASWSRTVIDTPSACSPESCLVAQIYAHDDHGTRVLDPGAPSASESVTNLKLVGNLLTWDSNGTPRQATLR